MVNRRRLATAIGAGLSAACVLALAVWSVRCTAIFSVEDFASNGGVPSDAGSDADGACVADGDHRSDPQNCGACGHSCLGGQCKEGKCEPVVMASGTGCPMGIFVYGDEIYWTEWDRPYVATGGKIARVLISTRVVTVMDETTLIPGLIAADESAVYWSELSTKPLADSGDAGLWDGHVWKLAKSRIGQPGGAGAPEMLRWGDHTLGAIALSGSDIYYTGYHNLLKLPKDGGIYTKVSPPLGFAGGVAVDQTGVFFTDLRDGSVWSLGGGDAALLVSGDDMTPLGIAVDNQHVYWTNWYPSGTDAGHLVMKADKYLPGDASVVAQNQQNPRGIAVDGNYVYWANSASGKIMRIAKAGGVADAVATGNEPQSIAVDMKAIYWADCGSGSVMALAK